MYSHGHIGISLTFISPVVFYLIVIGNSPFLAAWTLLFISSTASIPDIDIKYNFIQHRGITHTVWFGILFGIFCSVLTFLFIYGVNQSQILLIENNVDVTEMFGFLSEGSIFSESMAIQLIMYHFFLGFITIIFHLIGDVITPAGLRPFSKPKYLPNLFIFSDKRYSFSLTYARNSFSNTIFLIIGLLLNSVIYLNF